LVRLDKVFRQSPKVIACEIKDLRISDPPVAMYGVWQQPHQAAIVFGRRAFDGDSCLPRELRVVLEKN
jgi:hypothetical protein